MTWEKDDLLEILERDFTDNPKAWDRGSTNDDMVDSMCICFALDADWMKLFDEWVAANTVVVDGKEYLKRNVNNDGTVEWWYPTKKREIDRIMEHHDRVDEWLQDKERYSGYVRGEPDIMGFAINY